MASNVVFNGVTYSIPSNGDSDWGPDLTNYFISIAANSLQKTGGNFTLTSEVNFGSSFGLKTASIKSQATNPSATGFMRLGNAEKVSWRNAANSADIYLSVDASDNLSFNGTKLQTEVSVSDSSTIDFSLVANAISAVVVNDSLTNAHINSAAAIAYSKLNLAASIVNADISTLAAIAYSKLNLTGNIVNADISASAAIALSKIATVAASKVLVSDATGFISASTVTSTELAMLSGKTGVLVTEAGTQTLTNKTIAMGSNTITGLTNAAIDAAAAIARTKLASGSNSHVLINDGSGVMSSEAQLSISRGGTGAATANAALNALLPTQTSQSGKFLSTNGTDTAWTSGAVNLAVVSKTTTYTASISDDVILCSTSGGAWTLTLPTAVGNSGKVLQIKKTTNDFTVLTIDGNSTETIDGSQQTTLDTQYESVRIVSDGSNWLTLSRVIPSAWVDHGAITITGVTSNPTKGTIVTDRLLAMRDGPNLLVRLEFNQSTGTANGSGNYLFAIPSGLTIDTTKVTAFTGTGNSDQTNDVGGMSGGSNATSVQGRVIVYDSTKVRFLAGSIGAATVAFVGSAFIPIGAALRYNATFSVPITGWKG